MIAGVSFALAGLLGGILLWLFASGADRIPPLPGGQAPQQAELERLHAIRDRMAAIRELDVASKVQEGYVSRDNFSEYVETFYGALNAAERAQFQTLTIMMQMLRMIGPEDDLLEIGSQSDSVGIAGFYDPYQKRLVVVADGLTGGANEEATFAHEYTHALQDQRFNLVQFLTSDAKDEGLEYDRTLSCVIEGDASVSALKYLEDVYGDNWIEVIIADLSSFEEELRSVVELQSSVPPAILRYTLFNYNECASFALEVWEEGGWDAVDALYETPPSTTEQILHPERYFNGEQALRVEMSNLRTALGLGWRLADTAPFGEFDVFNYLSSTGIQPFTARSAADGWGGGSMKLYTLGGGEQREVLLHIALVWDTESQLDQFRAAFEIALNRLAYENRSSDDGIWLWGGGGEHGRGIWDDDARRVDLIYATNEAAVERARIELSRTR